MSRPPPLFDVSRRSMRLARATKTGAAMFLHDLARVEVEERLSEVNKSFTDPIIIGPWADYWGADSASLQASRAIPDTETLAVEAASADLAIHGLSLHQHNDPVGQLVQMRHALRPDGLAIAVMFGGQTLSELRASLATAETEIRSGLAPRVAPMGDIRELGGLLQRAGFALPVADSLPQRVTYPSMTALIHDLRAMGEAGIIAAPRPPLSRSIMKRAEEIYAEAFPAEDGRIFATFELVFLTGWAPSPDQQKPLRPGSAIASLAHSLGSKEEKLSEN